jgi:hypothetical protein
MELAGKDRVGRVVPTLNTPLTKWIIRFSPAVRVAASERSGEATPSPRRNAGLGEDAASFGVALTARQSFVIKRFFAIKRSSAINHRSSMGREVGAKGFHLCG